MSRDENNQDTVSLKTADDLNVELCTVGGVAHDFRPQTYEFYGASRTSWVCVWCSGVACGDFSEADPCWLAYHHEPVPHRTRSGVSWPIGGGRP